MAALMMAYPASAAEQWINGASLEAGAGNHVNMVRLGVQSDFQRRWFVSNGTHVGGYWEASAAFWRGRAHQGISGQHQNIVNLGITPVFRLQSDDLRGWYAEGGIGLNLLSRRYDNNGTELSTHFQFGDHLGAGYVFANGWDLGARIQHFSNGGYKKPNDGVNFLMIRAARAF